MITIKDVIDWSKSHHFIKDGRVTRILNNDVEFSIVGGADGLYGDFINNFEVAVLSKKNKEFITKSFYDDSLVDDVIGYMSGEDLEELLNRVITDQNFQVR
jgi:hypothetical protein